MKYKDKKKYYWNKVYSKSKNIKILEFKYLNLVKIRRI
tara:strand:+ start:1079 stop:1192 length:114 start_codon:yes stop_codon:yes gene_type:complete